jgi:rRNA maturation RNase YbeY
MTSPSQSNIYFFFQKAVNLRDRRRLKYFIREIFRRESKQVESLNYIFCSDAQLLAINQQYLEHDDYTDIITFELSEKRKPVIGEIYISIDRVRENARVHGTTLSDELRRVMFHGALHLCGYGDKTPKEKRRMTEMEDHYLEYYLSYRFT